MAAAYPLPPVAGQLAPSVAAGGLSDAHALAALAALGQATRLAIFRLLVRREPLGLSAGAIAASVGATANTLSTHLAILARAGLIRGTRDGRSIVYRADLEGMRSLLGFLLDDCCDGRPEICAAVSGAVAPACVCVPTAHDGGDQR